MRSIRHTTARKQGPTDRFLLVSLSKRGAGLITRRGRCFRSATGSVAKGGAREGNAFGKTGDGHGTLIAAGGLGDIIAHVGEELTGGYRAIFVGVSFSMQPL